MRRCRRWSRMPTCGASSGAGPGGALRGSSGPTLPPAPWARWWPCGLELGIVVSWGADFDETVGDFDHLLTLHRRQQQLVKLGFELAHFVRVGVEVRKPLERLGQRDGERFGFFVDMALQLLEQAEGQVVEAAVFLGLLGGDGLLGQQFQLLAGFFDGDVAFVELLADGLGALAYSN